MYPPTKLKSSSLKQARRQLKAPKYECSQIHIVFFSSSSIFMIILFLQASKWLGFYCSCSMELITLLASFPFQNIPSISIGRMGMGRGSVNIFNKLPNSISKSSTTLYIIKQNEITT